MNLFHKKHLKKDIISIIDKKDLNKRYIIFIISLFVYALGYNLFFVEHNLVFGGTGGIAILFDKYISPSITMLIISFLTLIFAFLFLDRKTALNSVIGSILLPIFVSLTQDISLSISDDDLMLIAICGAVILGIASGFMGRTGFSFGGVEHIITFMTKKLKISPGTAYLIVNGTIVFLGGYIHGWRTILYALIIIYIISMITDKVLLGVSENKTFFIVTNKEEEIKEYILQNLSRGVTVLDAHGGYTNGKMKVIMFVIPTTEYFRAREGILEIDPHAFFTISDSYQVFGADTHREKKNLEVE